MPILINKRPFFSIIVPSYNSRKTIGRLLDSLLIQGLKYQDMEIIISDDCSTESNQDIIDLYKNKLNIIQTKTDYNCCPSNARQKGVEKATGEWLCFADSDDYFVTGTLYTIKNFIQQKKSNTVVYTHFYRADKEEKNFYPMDPHASQTHGKFFNLDNFWNKYNFSYPKDLLSNEDVYILQRATFLQKVYNIPFYIFDIFTYIWVETPQSYCRKKIIINNEKHAFDDAFLIDYLNTTVGINYKLYNQYPITQQIKNLVIHTMRESILYSYFYFERGIKYNPHYLIQNCKQIKKYLKIIKETFNITIKDIYNYYKLNSQEYIKAFSLSDCNFLLEKSFGEWLSWIWNEEYKKDAGNYFISF